MTSTPATITIPRLDEETPRAYAARVEYLTMGPQRSLDKLAGHKRGTSGVSNTTAENWSVKYGWGAAAAAYDQTLANLAARAHAESYQRDLEAHRADAMQYGRALCGVAVAMLAQLQAHHKAIEYTPAALATIARALTTGLDLRAHALDLDRLLPTLTSEGGD